MKRLIVCLDGTWNKPDNGDNPTNVVKLMRAVRTGSSASDGASVPQVVFYDPGVGTGGALDKVVGGAFGEGLEQNVRDGYRFLANNYEAEDEIYLFGFSRGAFTARSLAGFIGRVGLAAKARMYRLEALWNYYRACKPGQPAPKPPKVVTEALEFGHPNVRIKCVGVWDTVGALGVPGETLQWVNRGKFEFHDVTLGPYVDVALHAVAIDEQRGPFQPALWEPPPPPKPDDPPRKPQIVEQVWFPGVHSNIGGSYKDARLSDLALDWMIKRVRATTGLDFDDRYIGERVAGDAAGTLYDSRTALYSVSKAMPFLRLIGQNPVPKAWWRRWIQRMNVREGGRPYAGEMIHQSAIDRARGDPDYRPPNLAAALAPDAPHKLPIVAYDGSHQPG